MDTRAKWRAQRYKKEWVKDCLLEGDMRTLLIDVRSKLNVTSGVLQGLVLTLIFFLVSVNDMPGMATYIKKI